MSKGSAKALSSVNAEPPSKAPHTKEDNFDANTSSKRDDDSNPQQGSGTSGGTDAKPALAPAKPVTPPASPQRVVPQRPSLLIPPTAKDERKLFVGGLPADVTSEEFATFFAQFGQVLDCIVMFDYNTGRSRGFGFVTYEDPAVSRYLLSLGHEHNPDGSTSTGRIQMRDKLIEIKQAEPKAGRSRPNQQHQGRGARMGKGGSGVAFHPQPVGGPVVPPYAGPADAPYYGAPYVAYPGYGFPPPATVYSAYPTGGVPTGGYMPGYMAPVFFPSAEMGGVMPDPAAPFAGYAWVPVPQPMPSPPPASSPVADSNTPTQDAE